VGYAILAVVLLGTVGFAFLRLDAARLASLLRLAGPVALGLVGLVLILAGRAGIGGMLISLAAGWFSAGRSRGSATKTPGQRSRVRSAALEMELDHDTGLMDGHVLAGSFEGRALGELDLAQSLVLRRELAGDAESLQLLETYLDGRFPVWRENADADIGDRKRSTPASGAMTKEEAYQVLGLEAGAAAADIRKAHRRLMQRLHPDIGGSSFLAARINEAKDILLSDQD
jgi:hypothetical protein